MQSKNAVFIAAIILSSFLHIALIDVSSSLFGKTEETISIPVTFVPEVFKEVEREDAVPVEESAKRAIQEEITPEKGRYSITHKDKLIRKYLLFLREEVEKRKYTPAEMKYFGLIGNVKIGFMIDSTGRFSRVRILRSSGNDMLDETAKKAIREVSGTIRRPDWTGKEQIHTRFIIKYQYGL